MTSAFSDRIIVHAEGGDPWRGCLTFQGRDYPCALGKAGLTAEKREGDHKTPMGRFCLRGLLYRPDRFAAPPRTALPVRSLTPHDGWCDAPEDVNYNRPVTLPYPASAETLWRDDGLYDLIVPLGYNDDPPVPGLGSAIFLHIARPGFSGTEGCVALARDHLIELLAGLSPTTVMVIGKN